MTTSGEKVADAAARRLPDFIRTLRINREKRRESVYASDNVYALLDALDTAEARVRELEAEIADTYERCAKVADKIADEHSRWKGDAISADVAEQVAAAIRQLAKEVKHEAE